MKSSQEISVAHLETIRQRRMRRIRRQRAIEVGKPVDVSLKPMALNSVQKKELSGLQLHAHGDQKHQGAKRSRASVLASLGLHLIAVLLGSYYVLKPARLDAETKNGDTIPYSICTIGIGGRSLLHRRCLPPTRIYVPTPGYEKIRRDAFSSLEVTRPPSFRKKVEPKYPSEAKRAGKEGKVVLMATIDVDGKAKEIEVKEDEVGFGCARAVIQALKSSRFNPGKLGDEIVPYRIAIPYQFKLEDEVTRANRQQTRVNHRSPRTSIESDLVKIVEVGCW